MKASIITVCYNSAATIEQTIQSVINQTYKDIEYIIIDGGSTDGTLDIIKKYDSNISYWVSEPDQGIYDAMNKGISQVTGDIVGIINSDDWYSECAVEEAVEVLKNQECQVVYGDLTFVSADGKMNFASAKNIEPTDIYHRNIHWHPTVFVNAKVYQQYGGFDCRYKIYADYQFLLRLVYHHVAFCYIPFNMAYFRTTGYNTKVPWHCAMEEKKIALEGLEQVRASEREKIRKKIKKHYDRNMCMAVEGYCESRICKHPSMGKYVKEVLRRFFQSIECFQIFGAGKDGGTCAQYLAKSDISLTCFIDNDTSKQGNPYERIPVLSLSNLKKSHKLIQIIVATSKYEEEIGKQLETDGLVYQKDFIYFADLKKRILSLYIQKIAGCK